MSTQHVGLVLGLAGFDIINTEKKRILNQGIFIFYVSVVVGLFSSNFFCYDEEETCFPIILKERRRKIVM